MRPISSSSKPSMSDVMLLTVALRRVWAMMPGIATMRPTTVVTSAAEMDGAIVARFALVTTVVGLLIAIPGIVAHTKLNASVRSITSDMEGFEDELMGRIACEFQGRGA